MSILKRVISKYLYSFLLGGCLFSLVAQMPANREYQVKAVFIFNFTQFVEWPANVFSGSNAPLVIGILGQDPFGSYIDQTVAGEKVKDHPLVVQRYRTIEEVKECHILFIDRTEAANMKHIVTSLKGKSILTVSDAANFIGQGGMIRFITESNKIQFQINPEAAKAANLTISSKLLRLAEIVVPN